MCHHHGILETKLIGQFTRFSHFLKNANLQRWRLLEIDDLDSELPSEFRSQFTV